MLQFERRFSSIIRYGFTGFRATIAELPTCVETPPAMLFLQFRQIDQSGAPAAELLVIQMVGYDFRVF